MTRLLPTAPAALALLVALVVSNACGNGGDDPGEATTDVPAEADDVVPDGNDTPPDLPDDVGSDGTTCGNGVVEGDEECDGESPHGCLTACGSTGTSTCDPAGCRWQACMPPPETCNGIDDDCDGETDETLDVVVAEEPFRGSEWSTLDAVLVREPSGFAAVWADQRAAVGGRYEVAFNRFPVDGTTVDPDVLISIPPTSPPFFGSAAAPALVAAGDRYGVAWEDTRTHAPHLYAAVLDSAGTPVREPVRVSASPWAGFSGPDLAWTGDAFGLTWTACPLLCRIRLELLDRSGIITRASVVVSTTDAYSFGSSIAWNGLHHALFWADDRNHGDAYDGDAFVALLTADGEIVRTESALGPSRGTEPVVSALWTGSEFVAAWSGPDGSDPAATGIRLARIDADGEAIAPPGPLLPGFEARTPRLRRCGDQLALTWIDDEGDGDRVRFVRLLPDGTPISPVRIVSGPDREARLPDVVCVADRVVIVWTSFRRGVAFSDSLRWITLGCT